MKILTNLVYHRKFSEFTNDELPVLTKALEYAIIDFKEDNKFYAVKTCERILDEILKEEEFRKNKV